MELEANIFRIFVSLWYLPLVKTPKKMSDVKVTCAGWFIMELPNKASFPFSGRYYDHCKKCFLPIFIAAVFRETYSFIKIMQPISPNYNWENGVKQIKITEENLSQSCILCQLLRTKTLPSGSKCIKYFFWIFTTICFISAEWMWFI